MTIPSKKLSFINERSFLIYDPSSIQIRHKLSGKFYQTASWNLSDFNLKPAESQINFVLACDPFLIIFLVGSSKRIGNQVICMNRNDGMVRGFPLPSFDDVLDGNISYLENDISVKIVTNRATLIKLPLEKLTLDLSGPIEETVVIDHDDTLIQAKIFDISTNDNFVLVNLMNSSSCISQITSLCTQTHVLDKFSSILYITRAINSIFLAVKESAGSVLLHKFNLDSFELSGSFHLLDRIDSQSFVHFHLIQPAKVLLFCFKNEILTIQLLELTSMNLLELCTDEVGFLSSEIADVKVSKGLNVQILLSNGSIIDYIGLASRNTWTNTDNLFADKFEFNQWFNVLDEFLPLNEIPTDIPFLNSVTRSISNWNEMRSTVDRIIADTDINTLCRLCSIGFLIGTRGTNYAQFCKLFSVYSFDRIRVDFAISLKKEESIAKFLQIIPLNWYTRIKTDLTRGQLNELANYFINANITMYLDIIVGSDIEPMIILDFARRNHMTGELVNSLPLPTVLNYPFTKKEFVHVFQSLSDYRAKFLLLKTRYRYADMYQLFINNRNLLTSEESTINNLKKAIPDIATLPTHFYNKLSLYPTLPKFDISSPPQPQVTPIKSPSPLKKRTIRRVSFAPSPQLAIKSPPLHEAKPTEIQLGGLERKLATPRHHATILPSRLSSQLKLEKEVEAVSSGEEREILEEIETPSKRRGRRTVQEGVKAKKPSPSPSKARISPPSTTKGEKIEGEEGIRKLREKRSISLSPRKKTTTPSRGKSLSPSKRKGGIEPFVKEAKETLTEKEVPPEPVLLEKEPVQKISPMRSRKRRQVGEKTEAGGIDYFIVKDVHDSPRSHRHPSYYSPTRSSPVTSARKKPSRAAAESDSAPRRKLNFEESESAVDFSQSLQLEEQEMSSSPPQNVSIRRKRKQAAMRISTPKKQIVEDQNVRHSPRLVSKQRTTYSK